MRSLSMNPAIYTNDGGTNGSRLCLRVRSALGVSPIDASDSRDFRMSSRSSKPGLSIATPERPANPATGFTNFVDANSCRSA